MRWHVPSRLMMAGLALALAFAGSGCDKLKARMLVREGNTLFERGEYRNAIIKYESALSRDPDLNRVYRSIGLAYMAMYKPATVSPEDALYAGNAISSFKEFLVHYPDDDKVKDYYVGMLIETKHNDKAIEFYEEEHRLDPTDPKPVRGLASLYQKIGDFDNTLKWYREEQKLLEDPDEKAQNLYTVGVICWDKSYRFYHTMTKEEQDRVIEIGLESLKQALQLKPEYFEALTYVNLLYREKAKVVEDPEEKTRFTELANEYLQKALAVRRGEQPMPEHAVQKPEAGETSAEGEETGEMTEDSGEAATDAATDEAATEPEAGSETTDNSAQGS